MTNYTPCQYEKPITSTLARCNSKEHCEYQKRYDGTPIVYCRKKNRINDAIITFAREKDRMLERAVNGEEYHEKA